MEELRNTIIKNEIMDTPRLFLREMKVDDIVDIKLNK